MGLIRHFAPTVVALAVSWLWAFDLIDVWPAVYVAGSCAVFAGAVYAGRVQGEREAQERIAELMGYQD
jgi:hypothetical protein